MSSQLRNCPEGKLKTLAKFRDKLNVLCIMRCKWHFGLNDGTLWFKVIYLCVWLATGRNIEVNLDCQLY